MVHSLTDTLIDFFFRQPHVFRTKCNIFCHGFLKKLVLRILEDEADALTKPLAVHIFAVDIFTVDQDLTLGGLQKAVKVLHKGGFTAAGVTAQSDELSIFDAQIDMIKCFAFKGTALRINVGYLFQFDGHSSLHTSFVMSSTVRMPGGSGIPSFRRSLASDAMGGTSRCICCISLTCEKTS